MGFIDDALITTPIWVGGIFAGWYIAELGQWMWNMLEGNGSSETMLSTGSSGESTGTSGGDTLSGGIGAVAGQQAIDTQAAANAFGAEYSTYSATELATMAGFAPLTGGLSGALGTAIGSQFQSMAQAAAQMTTSQPPREAMPTPTTWTPVGPSYLTGTPHRGPSNAVFM